MAGRLLHSDSNISRRHWFVAVLVFGVLATIIATAAHYRQNYSGELAFPTPDSHTGFAKELQIKEFVKPEGLKIIGFVFFGRRSRVEILRCFLEVSLDYYHFSIAKLNLPSAIWSTMVVGWTKSIG